MRTLVSWFHLSFCPLPLWTKTFASQWHSFFMGQMPNLTNSVKPQKKNSALTQSEKIIHWFQPFFILYRTHEGTLPLCQRQYPSVIAKINTAV